MIVREKTKLSFAITALCFHTGIRHIPKVRQHLTIPSTPLLKTAVTTSQDGRPHLTRRLPHLTSLLPHLTRRSSSPYKTAIALQTALQNCRRQQKKPFLFCTLFVLHYLCTRFASRPSQQCQSHNLIFSLGEMLEWLKRHAWKACIRQKRIGGSNPPLSAVKTLQVEILTGLLLVVCSA